MNRPRIVSRPFDPESSRPNDAPVRRPLVSVLTATFDRAHTLERAIASVVAQTLRDWQHVLVDDGSNDSTPALLATLDADPRYRCLRVEHAGQAVAMNTGARVATGEYLALLDSDDEFLPHHLAESVAALERGADLVWGSASAVGPVDRQYYDDLEHPDARIHLRDCCMTSSIVIRARAWRRLGGYRDVFVADADLKARLVASGGVAVQRAGPTVVIHCEEEHRLSASVRAKAGSFFPI